MCRFLAALIALIPLGALANGHTFTSDQCDFTVTFPVQYVVKEIYKGEDAGVLASAKPNKDVRLAVECWPKENVSLRDFVRHVRTSLEAKGMEDVVSTLGRTDLGEVAITSARTNVGGKAVHLRLISYFGKRNRMDLRILDTNASGSREQIDFRNSVRRKQQ